MDFRLVEISYKLINIACLFSSYYKRVLIFTSITTLDDSSYINSGLSIN